MPYNRFAHPRQRVFYSWVLVFDFDVVLYHEPDLARSQLAEKLMILFVCFLSKCQIQCRNRSILMPVVQGAKSNSMQHVPHQSHLKFHDGLLLSRNHQYEPPNDTNWRGFADSIFFWYMRRHVHNWGDYRDPASPGWKYAVRHSWKITNWVEWAPGADRHLECRFNFHPFCWVSIGPKNGMPMNFDFTYIGTRRIAVVLAKNLDMQLNPYNWTYHGL